MRRESYVAFYEAVDGVIKDYVAILSQRDRRLSTASWWRRTRISISFAVSDLVRSTIQLTSVENTR